MVISSAENLLTYRYSCVERDSAIDGTVSRHQHKVPHPLNRPVLCAGSRFYRITSRVESSGKRHLGCGYFGATVIRTAISGKVKYSFLFNTHPSPEVSRTALDVVGTALSSDTRRGNILTCLQRIVHELETSDVSHQE